MGKWQKVRWVLRRVGVVGTSAAAAMLPFLPAVPALGIPAAILGIIGGAAAGLSHDLKRDAWTPEQRKEKTAASGKPPAPVEYNDE